MQLLLPTMAYAFEKKPSPTHENLELAILMKSHKRLSLKLKLIFLMFEAKTGGDGRLVGLPDVSHAVLVGLRGSAGSASRTV